MNYSELQTAIIRYAMRTGDTEFSQALPSMIAMAESRLNRELPLRVMEDDEALTGTIGSRKLSLPDDFVEPISLHLTTAGRYVKLKPSVAGEMPLKQENGEPTAWCIDTGSIQIDTPCDQPHTFTFRYRKSFALSQTATTNWLLSNHPDAYLAACLVWGGVFMMDPEQTAVWKALLEEALAEIGWKESRSRVGTLSVDPALVCRGGFDIATG
jgi:hypothetical protein